MESLDKKSANYSPEIQEALYHIQAIRNQVEMMGNNDSEVEHIKEIEMLLKKARLLLFRQERRSMLYKQINLKSNLSLMKEKVSLSDKVRAIVQRIPKGKTMTYGGVAKKAGVPGAARAVGTVMKGNYDKTVPCHRVIRSDGKIGEYNRGGPSAKYALLIKEGVSPKFLKK